MRGRAGEQGIVGIRTRRGLTRLTEISLGYLIWVGLPLGLGAVITLTLWAAL